MRYAEVALNVPVRKSFDYHIPDELTGSLRPGSLVRVEFGVAMQPAVVLAPARRKRHPCKPSPSLSCLILTPALSPPYLDLAHLAERDLPRPDRRLCLADAAALASPANPTAFIASCAMTWTPISRSK